MTASQEKKPIQIPSLEQVEREREKLRHQKEYRRMILNTVGILIVTAAVSILAATMFFPVLQVSGISMEPTLEDGDIILLEKTGTFDTGDLIGFYYQNKILLKRVIGRSGDYIDIDKNGNVYVNDELLDEPYVSEKSLGECDIEFPYQVPDGKVFVLGDHRSTSVDSRSSEIGCVSEEQVVGRVIFRIWPLGSIGFLE